MTTVGEKVEKRKKEGIRNMVNSKKKIRDLLLGKQSHKTPIF